MRCSAGDLVTPMLCNGTMSWLAFTCWLRDVTVYCTYILCLFVGFGVFSLWSGASGQAPDKCKGSCQDHWVVNVLDIGTD